METDLSDNSGNIINREIQEASIEYSVLEYSLCSFDESCEERAYMEWHKKRQSPVASPRRMGRYGPPLMFRPFFRFA